MLLDQFFAEAPYSMDQRRKEKTIAATLVELGRIHYHACGEYRKIMDILKYDPKKTYSTWDLPFLPVRIFKHQELCSVPRENVVKILTSSGTSGQAVSKIFLDAENTRNQSKALTRIMASFMGNSRLPLLYLDTAMVKKDRKMYSARGAGITGFSFFGKSPACYALDADMNLDIALVRDFIEQNGGSRILLFGYTYMIWQYVIRYLEERNICLNIPEGILFHIGGWKKLADQEISRDEFNRRAKERLGNVSIANYYGMAEQLGSVFVECEHGNMHCSNFSDVIIRRASDFSVANKGEKGVLELLSVLPTSYPGHAILTEDTGRILGIDDCPCGRLGKYFILEGRLKKAETRGCSDTYEQH